MFLKAKCASLVNATTLCVLKCNSKDAASATLKILRIKRVGRILVEI